MKFQVNYNILRLHIQHLNLPQIKIENSNRGSIPSAESIVIFKKEFFFVRMLTYADVI
jgi:hypothetical protein